MLVFNALQLALLVYTVWLCFDRMRDVQYRMRADATPLGREIARRVVAGDLVMARVIADAARPSAFSRVVSPVLAVQGGLDSQPEVDEAYADVEHDLERGVLTLRSLASIAVATGFCGAALHMGSFLSNDGSASGLGLDALEGAMSTMALGVAAAFPALAAHRMLKRARTEIAADVDRAVALVEAARRGEGNRMGSAMSHHA